MGGAAALGGLPQQLGGSGRVNQVVHRGPWPQLVELGRIEGAGLERCRICGTGHANRGGVHHQVGLHQGWLRQVLIGGAAQVAPGQGGELGCPRAAGLDEGCQGFGASGGHGDRPKAQLHEPCHHGPGTAAAAQHQGPLALPRSMA